MFFNPKEVAAFGEQTVSNKTELERELLYMELAKLNDEEREEFIRSEECKQLQEAGLISKRTLVRLSKNDDLSRRRKMVAFQLAKEKKDPLWTQLVKNRVRERYLIKQIMNKYHTGAERGAKLAQRSYLKTHKMAPMR